MTKLVLFGGLALVLTGCPGSPDGEPTINGPTEFGRNVGICVSPLPDFAEQELSQPDFQGQNLACANFQSSRLVNSDFTDTILALANFENATLVNPKFLRTDLIGANFEGVTIEGGRFQSANLKDALFEGSELTSVVFINTTCPSGRNSDELGDACKGNM